MGENILKALVASRLRLLFVAFLTLFITVGAYASHISGGSIKYKSLGNNQYYIEAAVFRDCSGATYNSWTENVDALCTSNSAAGWTSHVVNHLAFVAPVPAPFGGPYSAVQVNGGFGTGNILFAEEVSDVCDKILDPSKTPNTRCRGAGGTAQGYLRFKFSAIITLTPCNWWRIGFSPVCCRNTGSSNTSSGGMYVHTFVNTLDFPTNSAPDFADEVKPIPSACVGSEVLYGIGTLDHDGDSLRFELTCAMQDSSRCVQYRTGYTSTLPAPGLKMDSITGLISFTPATTGKRVVAFWVKEYERCTGKLKAQTLRDVQFRIETCTNKIPFDSSGIANVQGKTAVKLDDYKLQVCAGNYVSWEDTIYDPDLTDTLVFQTNLGKVMPGASMSVTHIASNHAVVKFEWAKPKIGKNPVKIFYLVYNDDKCDYPGNGFSLFQVEVRNSTSVDSLQRICLGRDTAYIEADGGRLYEWKSVYGDSLIWSGPNQNVWGDTTVNDTNKKIKFFPTITTFLEVWSDMRQGCISAAACQDRDSIKIVAAKDFNLITTNDTTICYHDSTITIGTKSDSTNFSYTYQWNTHSSIPKDSVQYPDVTPITSRMYYVTVESDSGCIKHDSVKVNVTPPMPRNIKATTPNDPTCVGNPAKITLEMGQVPTSCGISTSTCFNTVTATSNDSITRYNGNGSSTSPPNDWPCPYGGSKESVRLQMLYTAAELQTMGLRAGTIDGIGFNVVNTNGATTFKDFTIKMKCTTLSALPSGSFQGGLTTVFTAKSVTISNGWNMHTLDSNYSYFSGATSNMNLIVEVCFDNGTSTTSNAAVAYWPTTFNSCLTAYGSGSQCNSSFVSFASAVNRPTIQLSYCAQRDSSEFTYQWTPPLGLNSDTLKDPTATIYKSSEYSVVITDTFGLCADSTKIKINIADIDAGPDTSMCPNDSIQLFPSVVTSCKGQGVFVWTPSQYFKDDSVKNAIVSVPKTTVVTVTFHDTCGCALTDSLTVYADSVKFPLGINKNPDCGSNNGEITVRPVGGFGPYTYSIDSGATFGTDSVFKNLRIGFFGLKVIDSLGCESPISPDTLFNKGAPRIDTIITKDISCKSFADGEIDVRTTGGVAPLSYSVDSGTTWVSGSVIQNLKAGKYVVYARGAFGCTSFPRRITLTEPDTLTLDFSTAIDTCNDLGDGWAKAIVKGGVLPHNYQWSGSKVGAAHVPVQIGDSVYAKLFAYNQYNFKVTDSNGCVIDTTFEITERPLLKIDSTIISPVSCFGYNDGKIRIHVSGGTKNYAFSVDSGTTYLTPSPIDTNYIVIDTTQSLISNMYEGQYKIVVKDQYQCKAEQYVTITQPQIMNLSAVEDSLKICVSTCARLEVVSNGGNNVGHNYHWTPTVSTSNVANVCPKEKESIYSVYATDNKGCISNTILIKVELFDSLEIDMPNDTAICDGAYANLEAIASGGDLKGYTYVWQPFDNLTNAFIDNPIASPRTKTTYYLTINDECGTPQVSDSITIDILPQPKVDFVANVLKGCPPLTADFENSTNNSFQCKWVFGDGSTTETCEDVNKEFSKSGNYDVKLVVTSEDGCTDSLTKKNYIKVHPKPTASFAISPQPTTILDPRIKFKDLSLGKVVNWEWNFAGIDTSLKVNPKFRFSDEEPGKYPVKLSVSNAFGCTHDTIRKVIIDPEFFLYIPTSFTPNGDGKNDTWKPKGAGFEFDQYQVYVFDRWGKLVFESSDFDESWDGTIPGSNERAKIGVYTWRVIIGDAKNEKDLHERFGNVTILR